MFEKFKKEIKDHNARGYHEVEKIVDQEIPKFNNEPYYYFLNEIGYGSFFDRDLIILNPISEDVKQMLEILNLSNFNDKLPFATNGTNDGFYVIENFNKSKVFWFNLADNILEEVSKEFTKWIESLPKKLFNKDSYKAYKEIKNLEGIKKIIEERAKFKIELLKYDLKLTNEPSETEMLYLKRFNKITIKVTKLAESSLKFLTFQILRVGSDIGEENIEYCSIDLPNIEVGSNSLFTLFVFDPYNIKFKNIHLFYLPDIDIYSNQKVRYKEIKEFL